MKLKPIGDYYAWYCEWCDSRNLTLWTRFEKGKVVCGACHTPFPLKQEGETFHRQCALARII